jgi:hypothetical protein
LITFQIPIPKSPFVDKSTGLVNREWYLFLNSLFQTIGSGQIGLATQVLHGGGAGYSQVDLSADVTANPLQAANFPGLTGDVVVSVGSLASTITANAVTTLKVSSNAITNTRLAKMATLTVKGNNTGGTADPLDLTVAQVLTQLGLAQATPITNSLSGDVTLNAGVGVYSTGPSVAQGTTGTWFASGTVTIQGATGGSVISAKLWDGTTIFDSCNTAIVATTDGTLSLSGFIAAPAGNIRISVADSAVATDGVMLFNASGNSKDSTVTAFRIA